MPAIETLPTEHITHLRFQSLLKETIWGGRKLGSILNKPIGDRDHVAESWEIVDHGEDQSVVIGGPLQGKTLADLFAVHRDWLMGAWWTNRHRDAKSFPLLLKFLDCNRVLSVQVHPDDAYAQAMDPPDLGKTEAWVVLHAEPGAVIYAGLKSGIDREQLADLIQRGETEAALHSFEPSVGDCVFIPAGTVHALGAGLVIAEIQQSSDTTFRLFDWNRVDRDRHSRPLHVEASLNVTDYDRGPVHPVEGSHPVEASDLGERQDSSQAHAHGGSKVTSSLVRCDKFELDRVVLPPGKSHALHGRCETGGTTCVLASVIEGCVVIDGADQEMLNVGDSFLVPAATATLGVRATSQASLLLMRPV